MRAYEFAKKTGATWGQVLKLAEAAEVEIYSPLSVLEAEDCDALDAAFLKQGPECVRREAAAVVKRMEAKVAACLAAQAVHDKAQAEALEGARRRAIEAQQAADAAFAAPVAAPVEPAAAEPAVAKPAAPAAKSAAQTAAEALAAAMASVKEPVAEPAVVVDAADEGENADDAETDDADADADDAASDFADEDEDEDYLSGNDRRAAHQQKLPASKQQTKQQAKQQQAKEQQQAAKQAAAKQAAARGVAPARPAPAARKTPAKLQPPKSSVRISISAPPPRPANAAPTRVGGTRAGFQSVSMKTAAVQAAVVKPSITMSVSSREISVRGAIVVKELATKLGIRPNRLIADLMQLKVLASINQRVEPEVAVKIAQKYGYKVNVEHARDAANKKPVLKAIDADDEIPEDKPEQMRPRPPVVTFLGHVDHGKTTLMDYIRHTKVAAGEAGGITQAISAYQVDVNGRQITFLDTPGHAAFNAMRQRGAQLTDVAVIIIAADDGIMPQTQQAIQFARQAGVQIMVAITKCDKPTANPERVKQMLQKEGLTPEEWGGDVVCCEVSGTTGKGVDNLLEMILLQADVLELAANPSRRANGYVIEAELQQGFGPSATVLVTGGTLKVGDAILVGESFGKVRSLLDDRGRRVREAGPSAPVKVTGLSGVPEAGAEFRVMLDEKRARTLAEETARLRKESELSQTKAVSLDALMSQMGESGKLELSVVVKSDTQGSLEAVVESLREIKSSKVDLKIIGTGTGNVSLTDVKSAAAGKAIIVGFDVGTDSGVQGQARHDGVRINSFRIIYELMDFVKKSMLDLLPPEYTEKVKGHATVKAIYDIGKLGKIAGSQMLDGVLSSTARYRILRGGEKLWEGKVHTLKHFKDDVKEVTGQQECGICFQNFEKFAVGDVVECYMLEELPRSL